MATGRWDDDIHAGEVGSEFERGSSRFAHILLLAMAAFFTVFFLWARSATLDVVTRGEGKVIPSSQIQRVQNLEGGIVAEILVSEGDIVERDQLLLRIDNSLAEATMRENRGKYLSLLATVARLQAEVHGSAEIDFPQAVLQGDPKSVANEQSLFEARRRQAAEQVGILKAQADQKKQELVEMTARMKQLGRARALTQEEADLLAPLVKQGVSPRLDLLRIQQRLQEVTTEIEGIKVVIPRTQAAIRETEARVAEKLGAIRTESQQELNTKRVELIAIQQTLSAASDRVTRTDVRSPVRGTINKLFVTTIGGVIQPGQDLVEIVPLEDTLLIEAKIRPSDRAELRPGLDAMIKVTAYDFSIHGGLPATLIDISADTIVEDKGDKRGESFYRIRLRTDRNSLGPDKPIIPGMTATVDILTGHKTVLDYLLKPIIKARDNALRER